MMFDPQYKDNLDELNIWLNANGFTNRGVYGSARHKKGIPKDPNVLLRPTFNAFSDKSVTIMVTLTDVRVYTITETTPPQTNQNITHYWELHSSSPYQSPEELRTAVSAAYHREKSSMWGVNDAV